MNPWIINRYMDESLPRFMFVCFAAGYFPTLYRGGCVSATCKLQSFRWKVDGVTKDFGSSNCLCILQKSVLVGLKLDG